MRWCILAGCLFVLTGSYTTVLAQTCQPKLDCKPCPGNIYLQDQNGCETCDCHDACKNHECERNQECVPQKVQCFAAPCYPVASCMDVKGPCHRHLANNTRSTNDQPMVGMFTPKCDDNGQYKHKQCHASTGYCYCVDSQGRTIPGTSVRGAVDCSPYVADKCKLPSDRGPCDGRYIKWYFNTEKSQCEEFYYTCDGNENRFDSLDDCVQACWPKKQTVGDERLGDGSGASETSFTLVSNCVITFVISAILHL